MSLVIVKNKGSMPEHELFKLCSHMFKTSAINELETKYLMESIFTCWVALKPNEGLVKGMSNSKITVQEIAEALSS